MNVHPVSTLICNLGSELRFLPKHSELTPFFESFETDTELWSGVSYFNWFMLISFLLDVDLYQLCGRNVQV